MSFASDIVVVHDTDTMLHIDTVAYPKLEPSSPLATSVNCCAASRVRLSDRDLP